MDFQKRDRPKVLISCQRSDVSKQRRPSKRELVTHCMLNICDALYTRGDLMGLYDLPGVRYHKRVIADESFAVIA
jgi:hypothetical protein